MTFQLDNLDNLLETKIFTLSSGGAKSVAVFEDVKKG